MRANDLCPPPHLEAADLDGDTEVTVKSVGHAEVGEEKAKKGIILFKEFPRSMVVNRTNLRRIATQHGEETDKWVGKTVTLFPSETDFAGRTVPCIRVRII